MMSDFTISVNDLLRMGVHPLIVIMILPTAIFVSLLCVRIYISHTRYRCTECGHVFRPKLSRTHVGYHDNTGRDQYCPNCRKVTYCRYADFE